MGRLPTLALVACASLSANASAELVADFAYTADALSNVSGGIDRGSAVLQDIHVGFAFELDELMSNANGGRVYLDFLYNDDTTFSDRFVGDAQVVSNIDSTEAFRIYEFWYEHDVSDALNLRVGLYDLNSEFDSIETSGLFLNSSHGIGKEYSQTGLNGPSIFPVTSLAARVNWRLDERNEIRYAMLDAAPGDPDDYSATKIELSSREGVLHALEYNHSLPAGTRFGVGAFAYSERFDAIDQSGAGLDPITRSGNSGFYGFVDSPVFQSKDNDLNATAFLRYGVANDAINVFDSYIGAGIVINAPFSNADEQLGFAYAQANTGSTARRLAGIKSKETTLELTYSRQINDWLRLQPDIQYIINPGMDPTRDNALVIGIRFEVSGQFKKL